MNNNLGIEEINKHDYQSIINLLNAGKLEEAKNYASELIKKYPNDFLIFNILGICLAKQNKHIASVENFEQSIKLKPNFMEGYFNLGNAHNNSGNPDKAVNCFKKALEIKPDYIEAQNNLGNVLFELGKTKESILCFKKALEIKPDFAMAYYNLGRAFKKIAKLEDSITCYEKAIKIKPDFENAYLNLGTIFSQLNKINQAIACYESAIKINPNFAIAFNNLGGLFVGLGNFQKAILYYNRAIKINPYLATAHRQLSNATKYNVNHPHIKDMKKIIAQPDINDEQKMHLSFGLGKALEDTRDYDGAFKYLLEGNQLKRKTINYSINDDIKIFENFKKIFEKKLFKKITEYGNKEEMPIFIVGMPRSGTTLVEQILSSHTKVFAAGELNDLNDLIIHYFFSESKINFFKNLQEYNPLIFGKLGNAYLANIKKLSPGSKHIVDKMPMNFKWIGLIKLSLPNAKIIHCVRDAKDNCVSIFKNFFSTTGNEYAYNLVELGKYYNLYRDLMRHWRSVLPGTIYDISYETLIKKQKQETKKLLDFCGLEWDDSCMQFHKNNRFIGTASAVQIRQPIYVNSIKSWKRYERKIKVLLDLVNSKN